ncbi:response regulator [Marinomonas pollencensis]|uniref:histidine kinase n=1 Tax=Marinomonas pollencensis TaxID=491954 RepID=A0A3E0DFE1_9GAMM|nr:hybrid sensor histidine kinase/response regulator [Marinomonas pollencensis]REG81423.1 signal transduction histidine kinase [Marinomonas pollencensis]
MKTQKNLKPKFIAILILPFVLAVSAGLMYLDFERRQSFSNSNLASEVNRVYSRADSILNKFYWDSVDTTIHVTFQGVQQNIFKAKSTNQKDYSDLDSIFRNSFAMNQSVTQVRWIDRHGFERYRMNRIQNSNAPDKIVVVEENKLQDKSARYYFTEAKKLESGYIYLSKLDLNIENGRIVTPYQPTIRLATPIKDENNQFRGIIVINFNLSTVFNTLGSLNLPGLSVDLFTAQGNLRYSNTQPHSTFLDILGDQALDQKRTVVDGFYQKREGFQKLKSTPAEFPYHEIGSIDYAPQVRSGEQLELLVAVQKSHLEQLFKSNLLDSFLIGLIALISGMLLLLIIHIANKKVIRLNNELSKQLKISEQSREFKSQFLANMSHEIRTPMTAISGLLELLLKEDLDEKVVKRLNIIKDSSDGLRRIINDILDLSKIESGKSVLAETEFRPAITIERSIATFNGSANLQGTSLLLDMEPSLFFYYCTGDEYRIEQVINNLLSNAIKFSNNKPISLIVKSKLNTNNTLTLSCAVIDKGVGMSDALVATLGEKFTQADNTVSKENGGTGLGLSISKELLRSMGSELEISSQLGKGSEFRFSLTLDIVNKSSVFNNEQIDIQALNVWIINKMNHSSDFINKLFQHWGCNATAISSQAELNKLIETLPAELDFIIFDLENPVSRDDVQSVIQHFSKEQLANTKLVLMSSNEAHSTRYKEANIDAYFIKKPVTISSFLELLQNLKLVPNIQFIESDDSNLVKSLEAEIIARVEQDGAPSILLVEDNLTNQSVISEIFKSINIHLVLASNGQEAVAAVHQQAFDMIFMDVQMPIMDGLEATKIIRESFSPEQLPIIALSAGVTEQEFYKSSKVGMNTHVPKPIDMHKLMKVVMEFWPTETKQVTPRAELAASQTKPLNAPSTPVEDAITLEELHSLERFDLANTVYKWLGSEAYHRVLLSFLSEYEEITINSDELSQKKKEAYVHKLKGVSGNLGAMHLFASCEKVESQLREKDVSIEPLLAELSQDISTLKRIKHEP